MKKINFLNTNSIDGFNFCYQHVNTNLQTKNKNKSLLKPKKIKDLLNTTSANTSIKLAETNATISDTFEQEDEDKEENNNKKNLVKLMHNDIELNLK